MLEAILDVELTQLMQPLRQHADNFDDAALTVALFATNSANRAIAEPHWGRLVSELLSDGSSRDHAGQLLADLLVDSSVRPDAGMASSRGASVIVAVLVALIGVGEPADTCAEVCMRVLDVAKARRTKILECAAKLAADDAGWGRFAP